MDCGFLNNTFRVFVYFFKNDFRDFLIPVNDRGFVRNNFQRLPRQGLVDFLNIFKDYLGKHSEIFLFSIFQDSLPKN